MWVRFGLMHTVTQDERRQLRFAQTRPIRRQHFILSCSHLHSCLKLLQIQRALRAFHQRICFWQITVIPSTPDCVYWPHMKEALPCALWEICIPLYFGVLRNTDLQRHVFPHTKKLGVTVQQLLVFVGVK